MTGGIDQIEPSIGVGEIEDRARNRDSALLFDLHPVGGGAFPISLGAHMSCFADRSTVQSIFSVVVDFPASRLTMANVRLLEINSFIASRLAGQI